KLLIKSATILLLNMANSSLPCSYILECISQCCECFCPCYDEDGFTCPCNKKKIFFNVSSTPTAASAQPTNAKPTTPQMLSQVAVQTLKTASETTPLIATKK